MDFLEHLDLVIHPDGAIESMTEFVFRISGQKDGEAIFNLLSQQAYYQTSNSQIFSSTLSSTRRKMLNAKPSNPACPWDSAAIVIVYLTHSRDSVGKL